MTHVDDADRQFCRKAYIERLFTDEARFRRCQVPPVVRRQVGFKDQDARRVERKQVARPDAPSAYSGRRAYIRRRRR